MRKHIKSITAGLLTATLLISMGVGGASAATPYKDVPSTHKAAAEINYLTERNIIEGFTDNTFRPGKTVTRAEASRIIWGGANYLGITYPASKKRPMVAFSDVRTNYWYSEPITNMYENRIISGYPDKSFRPSETVTHAQLAKMVSDAFRMKNSTVKLPFTDVKVGGWYEQSVKNVYASKLMTNVGTKFDPNKKMDRAQVSQYVAKAMIASAYNQNGEDTPIDDSLEELVPWDGAKP